MTTERDQTVSERNLPEPEPAVAAAPAADPSLLGLPAFTVGSIALGLTQVGFLPAAAAGGVLPIILAATGLGLLVATIWAAALGQSTVAGIFGIFTGFWWSYAILVLGLGHGWFTVATADATRVVGLFLLSWTILIAVLTLATLRLPAAFTALLALVTLAPALETIGTLLPASALIKVGGVVVLLFAALGVYLFVAASEVALGGAGYQLGRPVRR